MSKSAQEYDMSTDFNKYAAQMLVLSKSENSDCLYEGFT